MYLCVPWYIRSHTLSSDTICSLVLTRSEIRCNWCLALRTQVANHISRDFVLHEREGNDHWRDEKRSQRIHPTNPKVTKAAYVIRGDTIWTTLYNTNCWPGPIRDERASPIAERIFAFSCTARSSHEPRAVPNASCGHKNPRPPDQRTLLERKKNQETSPNYIECVCVSR